MYGMKRTMIAKLYGKRNTRKECEIWQTDRVVYPLTAKIFFQLLKNGCIPIMIASSDN